MIKQTARKPRSVCRRKRGLTPKVSRPSTTRRLAVSRMQKAKTPSSCLAISSAPSMEYRWMMGSPSHSVLTDRSNCLSSCDTDDGLQQVAKTARKWVWDKILRYKDNYGPWTFLITAQCRTDPRVVVDLAVVDEPDVGQGVEAHWLHAPDVVHDGEAVEAQAAVAEVVDVLDSEGVWPPMRDVVDGVALHGDVVIASKHGPDAAHGWSAQVRGRVGWVEGTSRRIQGSSVAEQQEPPTVGPQGTGDGDMSELLVGSLIIESNIDDVDNKVTEMRDKADNRRHKQKTERENEKRIARCLVTDLTDARSNGWRVLLTYLRYVYPVVLMQSKDLRDVARVLSPHSARQLTQRASCTTQPHSTTRASRV
ncbi:hypothetical protein C0Q70_10141 [Pomacea canaliculata]|uniref:Uncharacterized protein n=1 Tax=Pomacea canaliculata TaxID=400727 RepID=A0A2T7PBS5_POMCA|nr:hypothetical protein C0Q70_10141 [Pomacea canaliculata]